MKLEKFEGIIDGLLYYYNKNIGVGHTYTMLNGVKNNDKEIIILGSTKEKIKHHVVRIKNAIPMSIQSPESLLGYNHPLAIDNDAMWWLLSEMKLHLNELRNAKIFKE